MEFGDVRFCYDNYDSAQAILLYFTKSAGIDRDFAFFDADSMCWVRSFESTGCSFFSSCLSGRFPFG